MGRNLTDIHDLVHAVADQLTFIQEEGMRAAVQRMLKHQYESQGRRHERFYCDSPFR